MKRCLFLLLLLACAGLRSGAQPVPVKLRPLEGYFILGKHQLDKGINCLVVNNRKDFVKLFGIMNRPDTPDFSKETMLVLALSPSRKQSRISFERVLYKAGDYIEVYCGVQLNLFPVTYLAYPIVTAVIPRQPDVRTVNFYNEKSMKLLASVPVGH